MAGLLFRQAVWQDVDVALTLFAGERTIAYELVDD